MKATEIQPGDFYKRKGMRKWRTAKCIFHWKEGDAESLKNKTLIILQNCKQEVIPNNEEIEILK